MSNFFYFSDTFQGAEILKNKEENMVTNEINFDVQKNLIH